MTRILVAYGTYDGQTAKIAAYVGGVAREGGCEVDISPCKDLPEHLDLRAYEAVILAAPVHNGKHEASVADFVRRYRVALDSIPVAIFSVGLVPCLPRFLRRRATASMVAAFAKQTGWEPKTMSMVGGALQYPSYTPRQRAFMKFFMKLLGGPTDTSRSHELTDWTSVRQFTEIFLASLRQPAMPGAEVALDAAIRPKSTSSDDSYAQLEEGAQQQGNDEATMSTHAMHSYTDDLALMQRLHDHRSRKVIFLSHCLLNENTRYPGGACHAGCILHMVQQCVDSNLGIVQLPCPEELAWGGVLKRSLLFAFGLKDRHPFLYRLRQLLVPLVLLYSRFRYRSLARATARQVADYVRSGYTVAGFVGVDGSPSCGVTTTLATRNLDDLLSLRRDAITVARLNGWVRQHAKPGSGMFVQALRKSIRRRGLTIPFLAHDLLAELDGRPTRLDLFARSEGEGQNPTSDAALT